MQFAFLGDVTPLPSASRRRAHAPFALLALALLSCRAQPTPAPRDEQETAVVAAASVATVGEAAGPIRMEALGSDVEPPIFVMRGAPRGPARLVFLHGMCGHGLGYAQSFQWNAAKKGTLIAPQGDVGCGGAFSKWSNDVDALDARIQRAFRALGDERDDAEVTIMGMSQGADRAVRLAKRFPRRYTRLISMDAPSVIKVGELRGLRGAVMMAGELDRQDLMRQSVRALTASGVRATFMLIPRARHGAMGPTPEQTMGAALDWLWAD